MARSNAAAPAVNASQRSMRSQVAASEGKKSAAAASDASAARTNQQSLGSRREIRTGGFSKLGEEIMHQ